MPSPPDPNELLARLPKQWAEALTAMGEPPYRAKQIFHWLHQRGLFDPGAMTDLPKALRTKLQEAGLQAPAQIEEVHRSADGARKLLLRLTDGAAVETVLLPVTSKGAVADADAAPVEGDEEEEGDASSAPAASGPAIRVTLCISTQVGCALGCVFCASGVGGLQRQLTAGEIVSQVLLGMSAFEPDESLGNVLFMGMGEPLHNYEATAQAIRLLTHPEGLGLSTRRITLSTVGLPEGLRRLGEDFGGQIGLALSLHAATDELRSALMPINRRHSVQAVIEAVRHYPSSRFRPVTVEYALMAGQNDAIADAEKLAKLLRGLQVKINLIPMNPIESSALRPSSSDAVRAFQQTLRDAGYLCFIRRRRGDDVAAACGQLVGRDTSR